MHIFSAPAVQNAVLCVHPLLERTVVTIMMDAGRFPHLHLARLLVQVISALTVLNFAPRVHPLLARIESPEVLTRRKP